MKKQFTDEKTGISYTLHGDYYLPDIVLTNDPETRQIGIYGERHRRFLKAHQRVVYTELLISGKLHTYLADIDEQAQARFELLMKQMAEKESVTEELKAENQMLWVQRMNSIRNRAMEIVNSEIIYA